MSINMVPFTKILDVINVVPILHENNSQLEIPHANNSQPPPQSKKELKDASTKSVTIM